MFNGLLRTCTLVEEEKGKNLTCCYFSIVVCIFCKHALNCMNSIKKTHVNLVSILVFILAFILVLVVVLMALPVQYCLELT